MMSLVVQVYGELSRHVLTATSADVIHDVTPHTLSGVTCSRTKQNALLTCGTEATPAFHACADTKLAYMSRPFYDQQICSAGQGII